MSSNKKEAKVKPTAKVSGLGKPTLTGRKFKATWKLPNTLKGDNNAKRATHLFVWWTATYLDPKGKKHTKELVTRKKKGKTFHYADLTPDKTCHTLMLDRSTWYPKTVTVGKTKKKEKRKLVSVTVTVAAYNKGGVAATKHRAKATYTFHNPEDPVLSASFNRSNGKATFTATSKVNSGPYERYDIVGWVDRKDNLPGTKYNTFKRVIALSSCASDKDAWTKTLNLGSVNSFTYDQYICLRFRSYCRGVRGDSYHKKSVTNKAGKTVKKNVRAQEKTIYICYPPLAKITSIQCVPDKRMTWDKKQRKFVPTTPMIYNGRITISLKTNATTSRPVDSVQLEILKNSDAKTAQEAFGSDGWQQVEGMADNNKCTALTDTYANAYPDAGKHVWYRVVSVHNGFERYSDAVEATGLYHAPDTAASDVFLVDAKLVKDNASVSSNTPTPAGIHVIYGMNDKAHRTGTETAWSQTLFSAVSTNSPEAFSNKSLVSNATAKTWNKRYNKKYKYYGHAYVTGLEEGGKYYLAARNYRELADTGTVKYGKYSYFAGANKKAVPVLFALPPRNVTLTVPSAVTYGRSFIVSWTFDSNVQQTHYTLKYVVPKRDSSGNIVYKDAGSKDAVTIENALRARTASSANATLITADELKKAVYVDKDKRNRLCLRVSVETGGDPVTSSNAEASVYYTPNCKAKFQAKDYSETSAILNAQPLKVYYEHTNAKYVMFSVKSEGITAPRPDGEVVQTDGEVVYTATVPVTGDGSGVMTFPSTLELIDGGEYTVDVRVKGPSGLFSPTRTIKFRANWTHKAQPPDPEMTLAVGSMETMTALIRPVQPANWVKGDVCDIYRVTPDGVYRIASGVAFGSRVTDRHAPYSKTAILRYRIATRTADGAVEWIDVGYNIDGYAVRFDWGGSRTLTLPYNLKYSDSYTKDFLAETHMDGARTGWWNEGVARKASLSTDIVKAADPEQKELIKELAVYSGPVFVRTPNGCAFVGNVDVTNYDTSYDSLVIPVSFSATEIDLTDEFRVSQADIS